MDNLSKAVVMAGGVLISLCVISIALFFFTNASDVARRNEEILNSTQISSFNRFYTAYQDNFSVTGTTEVRCIDALNILNRAVEDDLNVALSSVYITKSGDAYVADSKNYTTVNVKYSLNYVPNVGIVSGVVIND